MFRRLIAGLLLASFSHGEKVKLDVDSNPNQVASHADHSDLDALKHLNMPSAATETVAVEFFLYTRKNLLEPQKIDYLKPDIIKNSNINPKVPLKFIIHGFGGRYNMAWVQNMKSAFLEKEDLNVIIVDWSLAAKPNYLQAAKNAEPVGAQVAAFFFALKNYLGVHEKDLHVIGFSLGAHVAGYVGKKMMKFHQTRPGRITGLDPSAAIFENYGGDVHLYKDDADYVDVLHTSAKDGIYPGLGMRKNIGHMDFYPNGGLRQPGCKSTLVLVLADIFTNEEKEAVCSHERAVNLFTESILNNSSCEFTAYPCSDYSKFQSGGCMSCEGSECARMGYYSQGGESFGAHYLLTTEEKPYCVGLSKLTVKFGSSGISSMGTITITFVSKSGQKQLLSMETGNFIPGDVKVLAMPISNVIADLSHVLVAYQKYIRFLPKSASTYSLSSITITKPGGKFIYKSCRITPLILKDNKIYKLRESSMEC